MADGLDVDQRPRDLARPLVCRDETSRQLLADVRPSLPVTPGHAARHDPEYVRGGVVNCVLVTAPRQGWRQVQVSTQRTRLDWAHGVRDLSDRHFPAAERIVRVMDQLTIHSSASLSAVFPPAAAKRLAERLEIHDTPKQGSWLNMAELELSVLERQCLRRRFADRASMERAVTAWTATRNASHTRITWQFTATDARLTLKRLYPAYQV